MMRSYPDKSCRISECDVRMERKKALKAMGDVLRCLPSRV